MSSAIGVPLEGLGLERMANGWSSVLLTEDVTWEGFPEYATRVAGLLGLRQREAVDGPDIRMRGLWAGTSGYWLVYDDFPLGVSLEPRSRRAAHRIEALYAKLRDVC